jgi:catechol 2,3-dioxygenase-like lactoylglutathione lyase family enzyme
MKMARIILLTGRMQAMSEFYGEVLGLNRVTVEEGWQEFDAGGLNIALHSGPASPGSKGPKIAFCAEDVAELRAKLVARGASFCKVGKRRCFAFATAKTRTEIPFNYRAAKGPSDFAFDLAQCPR